ncbi:Glutathione S-transferase, N-terminal domain [Rhizoctonia solani]|uniref:Glutathione S-transferase, N-terminal domain n=1 Tax=Rhizoctonia solani TaxID=456999 RepID=A0A8H7I8F3_9AGAM|nr:Glutathione S-transferase, N-terminal domain [Rhizoctonia solani]
MSPIFLRRQYVATMAATPENPIVFYDLINANGVHWSPNTYKTRLCLEYKGLPYRVEYSTLPEVESNMKKLGVPPVKATSPQYTLPDPSGDPDGKPHYVGDSFNIAVYLDEKYPARDTRRYSTLMRVASSIYSYTNIFQPLPESEAWWSCPS